MIANPWNPTSQQHTTADLMKPIIGPSAWTREELEKTKAYLYILSDIEISEIFNAVEKLENNSPDLHRVTKEEFRLPAFGPRLQKLREEIIHGRGFVFLRGLPTEGRSLYQTALAFWGIGCHIGRAVSQNGKGICWVT